MARIRTFIGVELDKTIRNRAVALQNKLAGTGAEVKWVEPENLHLTLLFLGEVDDREVVKVCRIVSDCTKKHAGFDMSVETAGCFPNPRRPRVIWVGVGEGAQELCAVHDDLETPLMALGYRREERRFTPHITLGRVRGEGATEVLSKALTQQAAWKGGEKKVDEIIVMSSELTSRGPIYTVLSRAPLA